MKHFCWVLHSFFHLELIPWMHCLWLILPSSRMYQVGVVQCEVDDRFLSRLFFWYCSFRYIGGFCVLLIWAGITVVGFGLTEYADCFPVTPASAKSSPWRFIHHLSHSDKVQTVSLHYVQYCHCSKIPNSLNHLNKLLCISLLSTECTENLECPCWNYHT